LPIDVSRTATGCSHFAEADFALEDVVVVDAAAFDAADFDVAAFDFVFEGVVLEVCARARPVIRSAAKRVLISRLSF
jgi:hypothetical protein